FGFIFVDSTGAVTRKTQRCALRSRRIPFLGAGELITVSLTGHEFQLYETAHA
ncbi:unnamed protein product, partial [Ectocarpus sp. 12 AP-2014]